MKSLSSLLDTLANHREEFTSEYKVKTLGIFGSYVRQEAHQESDLDVLVTFSQQPSLLKLVALENYFSDLTGVQVDLVMKDSLKPSIAKHILAEIVEV